MLDNKYSIFYCRTPINLIYSLALAQKPELKNKKKILILNKNNSCIHPKFIKKINKVITKRFEKIYYVNFYNHFIKGNIIKKVFLRSRNIQSVEKLSTFKKFENINIEKYYGCGDEFDNAFYNKYCSKKNVEFSFIEHGYGNLINTIISKPTLKNYILYSFLKFSHFFKILRAHPIKYKFFYGVLGKNFNKNINLYINNYKVNYVYVHNAFKEIKQLKKKINLKLPYKKRSTLINFSTFEVPKKKKDDLDKLIKNTVNLINKHEFCYYTTHPRNKDKERTINYLKQKLLSSNIRLNSIDLKKMQYFPTELVVYYLNTKKVISNLSSIPLNLSIIDKDINNYIFLDYSLNYSNINHGPALNKSCKKYYLKYFPNVKYI